MLETFEFGKRKFAVSYHVVKLEGYVSRGKRRDRTGVICVLREITKSTLGTPVTGLAIRKPREKNDLDAAKRVAARRAFEMFSVNEVHTISVNMALKRMGIKNPGKDPIAGRVFDVLYHEYRKTRYNRNKPASTADGVVEVLLPQDTIEKLNGYVREPVPA